MNNIDMTKWGEFSYIDSRLWERITHGQRLIAEDRVRGDVDYYSASEFNNSLTDQISNPLFIEKNCIVYNTFASAFYVSGEFTASDEIYCFHNKNLNKYNALFISTIMTKNKYKFKFGRKAFYNKFKDEMLKLPIDKNGNPDWKYMEEFIKQIENKINFNSISTINVPKKEIIDRTDWKEYKINDLFYVKGTGSISKTDIEEKYGNGEYPYITRTEKNNGISGFFDYKTSSKNILTIETTLSGLCFYHDYEFSTGDHIMVLIPKKFELNKYIALFIKTIWRKNAYKYGYGRPAISKNIKNTYLELPTKDGQPDWGYMESYIKSLPYGDLI